VAGTANIRYTVTNSCATASTTLFVTVDAMPATPSSITGTNEVCPGTGTLFTTSTPDGVWSSSDATVATINSTGPYYRSLVQVEAMISYTKTNLCGSASVVRTFTV